MKKVIMGNHAVSHAVRLARTQVVAAYPITPQTQIVEELSNMCAEGKLRAKFIKVESEHSAMACCIGAAAAGSRAFTATSSQGLALMHELLHWAAGARLPVVLAEVNRALAPGWNIWTEQTDSLAQRDTGWLQFYCTSNQEILDSILIAFRVAEEVSLPAMVVYDAFYLSHTYEAVDIPEQEPVDAFLPPYEPSVKLDVDNPMAFGSLTTPEYYMEMRHKIEEATERVHEVLPTTYEEFGRIFGREYKAVEPYRCDGADLILATSGTVSSTAQLVIETLRERGMRVGGLNIRMFRPFPARAVREALGRCKKVAVLDRNISFGQGGIFAQELKSALCNEPHRPQVFGFIAGLGGRDITPASIEEVILTADKLDAPEREIEWIGLKT
ncbi:MAG: pyruvate ferredoxin oxidoreductase [Candidatus Abyssobacteria bacterium SURF_17]|jgi:pyruvate/2-oxoacid:ferredoxin oxidoreductase alpha subunit|uniref:Pyruvate ferredoxin oxidoreductase n=1 Tax=Candidatus Abyssobacteria bacterium SURF_17 TaxID=2093361 RepID=A0A419F0M4_9BACT|nr:MAG: pyruvate ferredoxin oxidoreductase [Candidatus Abyssubacteria bacterium SURF_17]